ncbi:MAG TPA: sensor histidine kinase [Burkholderiales bacterium]|nr:sensor histidine kinase [Burkholderiales bacterium]
MDRTTGELAWIGGGALFRAVLLALALLLALVPSATGAASKVLIVFDEDNDLPGLAVINRSLREGFTAELKGEVELYSESLNLSQFTSPDHDAILLENFRRKYAGTRLDLVVAVLGPSLDFLLRHRDTLLPGVPIVFCGVEASELKGRLPARDVTGVLLHRSFAPTIDIALKLQPQARHLYVVGGSSGFDRHLQDTARRELAAFDTRLSIEYLTALPMRELIHTLQRLPPNSVVLFLTMLADGEGRSFIPHDALAEIARAANAPVYVAVDQFVGRGAVGGHVYSLAKHGRYAAQMGVRILRGQPAANIPIVEPEDHAVVFDSRALERWGLDDERLPPGSLIAYRAPSAWEQYKWYVAAGITLIMLEGVLIAGLLVNRAQRRRAEAAARESEARSRRAEDEARTQREELAHALRVSTLGELAASIAHELAQPLTAILANAQAARRQAASGHAHAKRDRDEALDDIVEAAMRADDTIKRLRSLFRRERTERVTVDVDALVEDVLRLLRSDFISRQIRVRFVRGQEPSPVSGDPVQLRQVLLNLLVNAADAIGAAGAEPRQIEVEVAERDGAHIVIRIHDTGAGVPDHELERIFEHYVSSKPHGLGMGLAISRSIVEAHGGRIWATRNTDRGLTLHVELPRLRSAPSLTGHATTGPE